MNESEFYQRVIRKMEGPLCLDRIENSIGSGFPDLCAAGGGKQFLIETKVSKLLNGVDSLFFEKFQLAFYMRRTACTGGKGVYIAALCNYEMDLCFYDAMQFNRVARHPYKKWNVVSVSDLTPFVTLTKSFSKEKMLEIAQMLIQRS
jgi:hypothetical protein